jgi:hydrogenase expression/formation protein HypE
MITDAMKTNDTKLPTGKLKYDLLENILSDFPASDPRVVVGPRVGEDAAVIDMGDRYLIVTADPITFTAENIGYYAINVNANDIAVRGARPLWFLATILLPLSASDEATARGVFNELRAAMAPFGLTLVGGHTEVTDAVTRPLVSGLMLGEVAKDRLVTTGGARPGDLLFLTKGIPVEGTAIIAQEKAAELRGRGIDEAAIERARRFLFDPGISVVADAMTAVGAAPLSSMHDPTEGGLSAGLNELAMAADVTITVRESAIPVYPEGRALCDAFGIDPLGTIASGALLFTAAPAHREAIEGAFAAAGIPVSAIGGIGKRSTDCVFIIRTNGTTEPLPYRERDEILRIF